jgi:hypothetical protein
MNEAIPPSPMSRSAPARTAAHIEARSGRLRKSYLDSPQPFEKSRFRQRKPSKCKEIQAFLLDFIWTNL